MASVQQRGESWRVRWMIGGAKGKKQNTTWPNEKLAQRAKQLAEAHNHNITDAEVYHAIAGTPLPQAGPGGGSGLPTVAEFSDLWLDTRTRISPLTIGTYRSQLRRKILPAIGHLRLDEVEGSHVALLLNDLRAEFKDTTVTRYYACLHALFEYAVRERKIPDNPARRTDFVRDIVAHDDASDEGEGHVYLTPQQFERICANCTPWAQRVLRVLAGTGLRWSEATAIPVSAVNIFAKPNATIRIYRAWKRDDEGRWYLGTTKGRTRRSIPIGPKLRDQVIVPLISDPGNGDPLLLRAPRGGRIIHSNFRARHWEPAVDAAMRCELHPPTDVKPDARGRWPHGAVSTCDCPTRLQERPTLHDLRHSHVAWMIAAGRPMVAISRRLGHATTAITEHVYAGILPEVDEAMADASDVAMGDSTALEVDLDEDAAELDQVDEDDVV